MRKIIIAAIVWCVLVLLFRVYISISEEASINEVLKRGDFNAVCKLLDSEKVNINTSIKEESGYPAIVNLFKNKKFKSTLRIYETTILIEVTKQGHAAEVKHLIDYYNAKIDAVDSNQRSALYYALKLPHEETALLLIKKGAKITDLFMPVPLGAHLIEGSPFFQIALSKGHFKIVKWIIDKESEHDMRSAIILAMSSDNEDLTLFYLEKGGVKYNSDQQLISFLFLESIKKGYLKVLEFLIRKGVGVNTVLVTEDDIASAKNASNEQGKVSGMPGGVLGVMPMVGMPGIGIQKNDNPPGMIELFEPMMVGTPGGVLEVMPMMGMPGGVPEVEGEVIGSEGESDTITSRPTSLDYAIASGSGTEILALLKKHGAKFSKAFKPLIEAAISDDLNALNNIFKDVEDINNQNINIEFHFEDSKFLTSILNWSVFQNNTNFVECFFNKGININAATNSLNNYFESSSPPHFDLLALSMHHKDNSNMVQVLINQNINVNGKNESGRTPLEFAFSNGRVNSARLLRENGGKIDSIFSAALVGDLEAIKDFLNAGLEINKKDNNGQTVLHVAIKEGHEEIIKFLISKRVDLNIKDSSGSTALFYAVTKNQNNIIKLLLEKGANVDVKNNSLFTPLHKAALGGADEALELLLSHNPNINALANSESTALDLVLMRAEMLGEQNSEIADLLRKNGGKTSEELKAEGK